MVDTDTEINKAWPSPHIILKINSWQGIRERIGMKHIFPPTQIVTNWQKILNLSACHPALSQNESNSLVLVPKHQNEF